MCGEHYLRTGLARSCRGSSPHVRGAPIQVQYASLQDGIIPACAGSTRPAYRVASCDWDHPRMCGEHRSVPASAFVLAGSSPHVRGAHWAVTRSILRTGIIPACAGSTRCRSRPRGSVRDHPRMRGEHSRSFPVTWTPQGSSPHVRGALQGFVDALELLGIIPACAGSTAGDIIGNDEERDHPRMRGEHSCRSCRKWCSLGSSPHVRGAR